MPYRKQLILHPEKNSSWLNELYDKYAPALMGVITRIVGNSVECEKILYQSFIEIWESRVNFNSSKEGVFIWMNKIARRRAISEVRATKHIDSPDFRKLIFSVEVEDYITGKTEVKEIDENERAAIRLLFINVYSFEEVAQKLQLPMEIIKAKVRMAINKIIGKS